MDVRCPRVLTLGSLFLMALWPLSLGAQEFEPLPRGVAPPRPTHSVAERLDRTRLEVRGGELWRTSREGALDVRLRCLAGQVLGTVHDLARDSEGGTYVAAEGGVFLVGIASDVADGVRLSSGTPPGSPRAVHLDARRRLWIATDVAFGVVDPVWGFGRTFDRDAVRAPAPPYQAITVEDDFLVLVGSDGAGRFPLGARLAPDFLHVWALPPIEERAEAEPSPTDAPPESLVLNQTSALPHVYGVPLTLRLHGVGQGGATYAYVIDGHHKWIPIDGYDVEFAELQPGRRRITLRAFDREMNWTDWTLTVDVSYPWFLERKILALLLAVVLGVVFSGAAFRAVQDGGGRRRFARAFVSAGLLVWIGMVLLGGVWPHARGWPFVGFSMYTGNFDENEIVSSVVMRRITEGGRYVDFNWRRLGRQDSPWQAIRPFLHAADAQRQKDFLERFNTLAAPEEAHGILVVAERHRLTADGPVRLPDVVMGHVVKESQGGR